MAVNEVDIAVGKRLSEVIAHYKMTSRQFALSIAMDPSQFAKVIKGKAALSLEKTLAISKKYKVNINWLVSGEGQMIYEGPKKYSEHDSIENITLNEDEIDNERMMEIILKADPEMLRAIYQLYKVVKKSMQ